MGESYGERIKRLRLQRGLTQLEMARLVGKDYRGPNTVCLWESDKGHPKWGDLERVAEALGCTIDYLVTGKNKRKPRGPDGIHRAILAPIHSDIRRTALLDEEDSSP